MKINELEKQLNIPRANIRFYEKEGLLSPIRKENSYRHYREDDISRLQKIIVLRKLGISVTDIKSVFDGKESLQNIIKQQSVILSEQIEELNGALEICNQIESDGIDIQSFDEAYYFDAIQNKESKGAKFADLCKDCLEFELNVFGTMMKYIFFHDFKKNATKFGYKKAFSIVLSICIIRGLSRYFLWGGSFWEGFLYPIILFAVITIILLPIHLLKNKYPRLYKVLNYILLFISITFLAGIFILIIVLLLNSWLHFWF